MAGKLPTTVIGSFPKPDYLPIRDWFDSARENGTMGSTDVTLGYTGWKASDADEALFRRAAEGDRPRSMLASMCRPTAKCGARTISIIIAATSLNRFPGS